MYLRYLDESLNPKEIEIFERGDAIYTLKDNIIVRWSIIEVSISQKLSNGKTEIEIIYYCTNKLAGHEKIPHYNAYKNPEDLTYDLVKNMVK